jgi:hypothetical protein
MNFHIVSANGIGESIAAKLSFAQANGGKMQYSN